MTHSIPSVPNPEILGSEQFGSQLFNSGVCAHALATAHEIGLLDRIEMSETFSIEELQDSGPVRAVLEVLVFANIVEQVNPGRYRAGPHFAIAKDFQGFFSWLFSASGSVLADAGRDIAKGTRPQNRDGGLVAWSTGEFGKRFIDPVVRSMPEIASARSLADFGCGDGSRLCDLLDTHPSLTGIGVDRSAEAIGRGRSRAVKEGRLERLAFVEADVANLQADNELMNVDTIFMALMAHDLLPAERCVNTLRTWGEKLPMAHTLVICETVRASGLMASGVPVLGYQYLHGLMGQELASTEDWYRILHLAGWPVVRAIELQIPASTTVFVCIRSDS